MNLQRKERKTVPQQVSDMFLKKHQVKTNDETFKLICHLNISGLMVINIEDVNDNAPEFIFSDSVFGEVISESVLECSYLLFYCLESDPFVL